MNTKRNNDGIATRPKWWHFLYHDKPRIFVLSLLVFAAGTMIPVSVRVRQYVHSTDPMEQSRNDHLKHVLLHSPQKWNEERRSVAEPSLQNITLKDASFVGLDFANANFTGAKMENVIFRDCTFSGASLREVALHDVQFAQSRFRRTRFVSKSILQHVVFSASNLEEAVFEWAVLEDVTFDHVTASGFEFNYLTIERVRMQDSDLTHGNLITPVKVEDFQIIDSNATGFGYRAGSNTAGIKVINSNGCAEHGLRQFCLKR